VPGFNKIIVIEGPDGAGKSTLAKNLGEHFKWPIVHGGGPLTNRHEFLDRARTKGWNTPEVPRIFDRVSYISERVYAKEPLVSSLELNIWLSKVKPVLIFCCLTSSAEMVRHIFAGPKAHKTIEHLEEVKKNHAEITRKYRFIMAPLYPINYDWEKCDFRNLLTQINNRIF
jgi:cytidylate kinase